MEEPVARFLLLMKEMHDGFAVLKMKEKGGAWFYEQPSFSFALPMLGFQLSKGILLDQDIKHNKEIIGLISKHIDDPIYYFPEKYALRIQIYDATKSHLVLDDKIKLISGKGFTTKMQIKWCYWKLKIEKNPLYKLFEGL